MIASIAQKRMAARAAGCIRFSLPLIAFLLNGNFHPDISLGGADSNSQLVVGLLFWLAVIASTFFLRPILEIEWSFGLYVTFAFFGVAIASGLWSDNAQGSLLKSAAQLVTLIGAWRLALTFPWEEIVAGFQRGLFAVCLLSAAAAIFIPSIGLVHDFMHEGQWCGLFSSKQTLGVCAALLLFFSTSLLLNGAGALYSWASIALSVVCVLGAGSRGGGALAVAATSASYFMSKSKGIAHTLAFMPFVMSVAYVGIIAYMLHTQNRYIVVFGQSLDFTSRTFIWQHALRYFWDWPWLGAGVNGFWTKSVVKSLFIERYGWFLDDYHNGYLAIVMETGIVGYALFLLAYLLLAFRINSPEHRAAFSKRQTLFGLSYVCLMFTINLTETFFLRSTNTLTTQLVMVSAFVFARPVAALKASRSNATVKIAPGRRPIERAMTAGKAFSCVE